jgi:site-specific DNA-methyltransferase (adenine-specific)
MAENTLYYGDNLDILRRYIKDETVDLVYLDPPSNSSATYNVLFAEQDGQKAAAQIKAFEDTWKRGQSGALTLYERRGVEVMEPRSNLNGSRLFR